LFLYFISLFLSFSFFFFFFFLFYKEMKDLFAI